MSVWLEGLHMWKVHANTLNKQLQTAKKGQCFGLWFGWS
jgi:hypothetical protein